MLKDIIIAIQSYFKAHNFIVKNRLWKWILIPGVIYIFLFATCIYFFWNSSGYIIDYFFTKTGLKIWMQREQDSWLKFLFIFGQLILQLILLFLYFSWFKYLFLIIGSPVFVYLSEKTKTIIDGKEFRFNRKEYFRDILRGSGFALRNLIWQTVYGISIFFLSLIPVIGWATPVLALFIECYYFGFSMLDYGSERNKLSVAESIDFIGRHKGLAIGNGIVFYLMHGIVIIGWMLAPSYAVVAATLSLYDERTVSELPDEPV